MFLRHSKYYSLVIFILLILVGCKTQKSVPPYGAYGNYSKTDTNQIQSKNNIVPSAELNREEAFQQNFDKPNNAQKTLSKSKKSKLSPKIDFCKLCQGYVLAKNAKKMLQPPQTKGCLGGIAVLLWVFILPLLVVIAVMMFFIAILTIIFSILILAAIIGGIAILILFGFGALTWFSGMLVGILSLIIAAFLLYMFCKKCK